MSINLTVTESVREEFFANPLSGAKVHAVDNVGKVSETIPGPSTDALVEASFPYTNLKVLYLLATGGDLNIDLMSGTHSALNITLLDGVPFNWHDSGVPNPLSEDVDEIYVDSIETSAVLLEGIYGYDNA